MSIFKAAALVACGMLATWLGHQFVCWRLTRMSKAERDRYRIPLFDVGHQWLPSLERWRAVSDGITSTLQLAMLISSCLFDVHFASFLGSAGLLYAIRALCFSVTLLPNCRHIPIDSQLTETWSHPSTSWKEALRRGAQNFFRVEKALRTGLNHHDLVFSGHMTMSLLCVLHWSQFLTLSPVVSCGLWALMGLQAIWIIAARNHYTLDVLVSWLFVTTAYRAFARPIDVWIYSM